DLSAQIIFGGIPSQGKLPVTTVNWIAGSGVNTGPQIRLKYTVPEEVGFSRKAMERIDSIVAEGIKEHAFPGCQVFAAKDGKVFFEKSYGHFTYEKKHTVRKDDLYDIASITKIVATVPAVMKMVEEKKMNMDEELSTYLPELKGTNKEEIVIREMLAHQAGLKAWIPFYLRTLDPDGGRDKKFYRSTFSDSFPIYVAPGVFLTKGYRDTIYKSITNSAVSPVHTYLYSDLGYYYLKRIIEQEKNMLLSIYADSVFYHPLGLPLLGFQPRLRIPTARIAPTENDKRWRGQLIQGDVHDQGAAMLGGIGGHAGVFSNANDVGVMMQLFLNYGEYGGRRYFDSMTVATFTSYQYLQNGNRRGIGFDKPETDPEKPNPACDSISCNSFGHQGFTGTQAWADPETGLVYVFLSNRIYPDAEQNKLVQLGIRTAIMQELVEGLK
ncbi:MAG TPA: serine hydrolase, partial [Bacteroidia bacterium]|nr:serine hydrolase [Bacteroidia bacterium]